MQAVQRLEGPGTSDLDDLSSNREIEIDEYLCAPRSTPEAPSTQRLLDLASDLKFSSESGSADASTLSPSSRSQSQVRNRETSPGSSTRRLIVVAQLTMLESSAIEKPDGLQTGERLA